MINIDVGVFAYNEANNIKQIIDEINKQNIFSATDISVKVYILANGCTDDTVQIAKNFIELKSYIHFEVVDFIVGGKSRTWNRFVHEISRENTDQLIFCDSDIWFTNIDVFKGLSEQLIENPNISAASSRPVKDISLNKDNLTFMDRAIASSGDGLNNWKTSICGQLYIIRSSVAKTIYLPTGLPVEDGYLRAMIVTDNMTESENLSKITGNENIFHLYRSERTIGALINHQTRIIIGSAINFLIFNYLREQNLNSLEMFKLTKSMANDELWLTQLIQAKLPAKNYGWVPWHFLIKRLQYAFSNPSGLLNFKKLITLVLGFGFDFIVFIKAQYKMARGTGVGYW